MTNDERLNILQNIFTNGFTLVVVSLRDALTQGSAQVNEALQRVSTEHIDEALVAIDDWLKHQEKPAADTPATDASASDETPKDGWTSSE